MFNDALHVFMARTGNKVWINEVKKEQVDNTLKEIRTNKLLDLSYLKVTIMSPSEQI